MAFIYMHGENVDYALREKKMRRLLDRLTTMIEEGRLTVHNTARDKKDEPDQ